MNPRAPVHVNQFHSAVAIFMFSFSWTHCGYVVVNKEEDENGLLPVYNALIGRLLLHSHQKQPSVASQRQAYLNQSFVQSWEPGNLSWHSWLHQSVFCSRSYLGMVGLLEVACFLQSVLSFLKVFAQPYKRSTLIRLQKTKIWHLSSAFKLGAD